MSRKPGLFAPLREEHFRRIWLASLVSNMGLLINAVGAAWAMTLLSGEPRMIALVQTAVMLPHMLFAIPAGAFCDIHDRRKVAIAANCAAFVASGTLFACALSGYLTPQLLLALCFLVGAGNAFFGPAWMASVGDQVPRNILPQGIALNSTSYNIARATGPALGGLLVATAGPFIAFGANALSYLPMLWAQLRWKKAPDCDDRPSETVHRALLSGLLFNLRSKPLAQTVLRTFCFATAGASIQALMPLIARDQLAGGASDFGILLGLFGIGAIMGVSVIGWLRDRISAEMQVAGAILVIAASVLTLAFSNSFALSGGALIPAGMAWMNVVNTFSVTIQTHAPRWIVGRAVANYQASMAGGLALGAWLWGEIAQAINLNCAIIASTAALACVALMGRALPAPSIEVRHLEE